MQNVLRHSTPAATSAQVSRRYFNVAYPSQGIDKFSQLKQ
jgi:hypothetical protein